MQPDRPRRVLAYARVSTAAQEDHRGGTSLEDQQEQFAAFCEAQGYPKPLVYVEVEGGGQEKTEKRVEQARLMRDATAGDLVLCTRQDRWSRSTLSFLQTTGELVAKGARFFSITERFDPATPEGRFAATIMAAVAEQEHARIRDRTLGARRRLRAMGKFVEGFAPLGYSADRDARTLIIDDEAAPIILRMFHLCADGKSTRQVSAVLEEEYPDVPGLDPSAVSRRLRSRVYLGEMMPKAPKRGRRGARQMDRENWTAAYPAIVDRALWIRAQAALEKRRGLGRPGSEDARTATFLLRGLVRCGGCGYVMASHSPTPGGSTTHGGWYMCRKRDSRERRCEFGPLVRHADLDAAVEADMLARLNEAIDGMVGRKGKATATPRLVPDFDAKKEALLRKRKRIVDALANDRLSEAEARETLDDVVAALESLEAQRDEHEARTAEKSPAERRQWLATLKVMRLAWAGMTVGEKRQLISRHAEKLLVYSTGAARWKRSGTWRHEVTWKPL